VFLLSPTHIAGGDMRVYSGLAMKKTILFAAMLLGAMTLTGYTGLSQTCVDGASSNGNCAPGKVTFTGSSYPSQIHVQVTRYSTGEAYDDWDYQAASDGTISFTETLYPADYYRVTVTSNAGTEQYTVATGTPIWHRDND
jgi:hypothetical protein